MKDELLKVELSGAITHTQLVEGVRGSSTGEPPTPRINIEFRTYDYTSEVVKPTSRTRRH